MERRKKEERKEEQKNFFCLKDYHSPIISYQMEIRVLGYHLRRRRG
jgi:hypothetical protein